MEFEWDEAKRLSNLAQHGVDFRNAIVIFDGFVIEANDVRNDYGETRIRAIGRTEDDEYYLVVYTWRGGKRRLISAWRVGDDGRRRYQELLS
jgi:uncharacterized DUF497 family protein